LFRASAKQHNGWDERIEKETKLVKKDHGQQTCCFETLGEVRRGPKKRQNVSNEGLPFYGPAGKIFARG